MIPQILHAMGDIPIAKGFGGAAISMIGSRSVVIALHHVNRQANSGKKAFEPPERGRILDGFPVRPEGLRGKRS